MTRRSTARLGVVVMIVAAAGPASRPIFCAEQRVLARARQPFVNQAGYNLGEAKRFTCPGAADGTPFRIERLPGGDPVFRGVIHDSVGDFSSFEPAASTEEYAVGVDGFDRSVPFLVANHLFAGADAYVAANLWDVRGRLAIRAVPNGAVFGASFTW